MALTLVGEQPGSGRLEHHAHRRRNGLEPREFLPAHHTGIEVWEQACLLEYPDRHRSHVVEGGVVAAFVQPLLGFRPASLGAIPQREQRFLAAQFGACPGNVQNLVRFQEHAVPSGTQLPRHRDECAVVALVLAQTGQRNENFPRIRHGVRPTRCQQTGIANLGRRRTQIGQIGSPCLQQRCRLVDVQGRSVACTTENSPHRRR